MCIEFFLLDYIPENWDDSAPKYGYLWGRALGESYEIASQNILTTSTTSSDVKAPFPQTLCASGIVLEDTYIQPALPLYIQTLLSSDVWALCYTFIL